MRSITIKNYFEEYNDVPLLDVRSPAEYQKGHVPCAFNLPLFSDDERSEVGTLYKQKSQEAAMKRGLEIAGSKITWYLDQARHLIKDKRIAVHCWRGGKRSASMATLLEFMGNETNVIKGGYKAYRNYILESFYFKVPKLIVIGGATGSGKTEVLHQLKEQGEQVIDLEGLAHHKGSAFGALGEKEQPTVEQFENLLYEEFRRLDFSKRVWVENESMSIGRVFIPAGIWDQLCNAFLIELDIPLKNRVDRLIQMYAQYPKDQLISSLVKIRKRLGGLNIKNAIAAYDAGDLETATEIALNYYDKSYRHATGKKSFLTKAIFETCNTKPANTANQLIQLAEKYDY